MFNALHHGGHRGNGDKTDRCVPPRTQRWEACVIAIALLGRFAAAQPPDVDAALEKAADYIYSYKRHFVGIVAEETYRQTVTRPPPANPKSTRPNPTPPLLTSPPSPLN